MHISCGQCDSRYEFDSSEGPDPAGIVRATLSCPLCMTELKLDFEPGEAVLAAQMGIPVQVPPEEGTADTSGPEKVIHAESHAAVEWEPEALKRLDRIPIFARGMAKRSIERYAREKGIAIITVDIMSAAKGESGQHQG